MYLAETVALIALFSLLVLLALFAAHRVQLLRRGGTHVVFRELPAAPGKGWRHGVVRYREEDLVFFRVSSLRPGPDRGVLRKSLVVLGRRQADVSERDVVPPGATVIHLRDDTTESEIALGGGALTALMSWIESCPPGRTQRIKR
ncbi:MAG: DUF2550 domain-containing protein [Mycobacteriaceae bacterium]